VRHGLRSITSYPNHWEAAMKKDNLALACHRCNGRRYTFTDGVDPVTARNAPQAAAL
jgi:hypothetical protein